MTYREGLANDPATHVLVIGVDDYTHLPPEGGGGPKVRGDEYAPGLTKVSTAGPSAEKLANWFLDPAGFQHPQRPLGSLDILLSSGSFTEMGNPAPTAVARPTFNNIRTAFFEWRNRCHTHEDNHAIFYFCGHGMEQSSHYLLAEDALDSLAALDENFIDLDATAKYMSQCKASTQLYFIDACRTPFPFKLDAISKNLLNMGNNFGRPLLTPQANGSFFNRHAVVFKSALKKGAPAKARVGQETYFAEGLIECLDHYGAADDANSGEYWVRIDSLREALQERMRRKSVKYFIPDLGCSCRPEEIHPTKKPDLHLLPAANARVQAQVVLLPEAALPHATIRLTALQGSGGPQYQRSPSSDPWVEEMAPGLYDVAVNFDSNGFVHPKTPAYLTMPTYNGRWPVV